MRADRRPSPNGPAPCPRRRSPFRGSMGHRPERARPETAWVRCSYPEPGSRARWSKRFAQMVHRSICANRLIRPRWRAPMIPEPAATPRRARRRRRRSCGWSTHRGPRAGTSSRSASLRAGMITSVRPARCAARSFCFTPPMGSTRPASVTSPVMPTSGFTGRPEASDASAVTIVMPALGPSLGTAPAGTCRWTRSLCQRGLIDAQLRSRASAGRTARSAPTPS